MFDRDSSGHRSDSERVRLRWSAHFYVGENVWLRTIFNGPHFADKEFTKLTQDLFAW